MTRLRETCVISSPILVALILCVLIIAVDVLVLREGRYQPVESPWHMVWGHAWILLLLLSFGVYAHVAVARHRAYERRLAHLNAVLAAVRNVNQLIVREPDRDRLLQGACEAMVEGAGWRSALIMLTSEDDRPHTLYQAGLAEETFANLPAWLREGNVPTCAARALQTPGIVTVSEPLVDCGECPLAGKTPEDAVMAARLEHGDSMYGVVVACTVRAMLHDPDEQALLDELAGDLAHALTAINAEAERRRAEEALRQSEARLSSILGTASVGIGATKDRVFLEVNEAMCRMTGYAPEKLVGRSVRMVYSTDEDYERTGAEIYEQLSATGSAMVETRWQTRQGAIIDVMVGAKPLAPGDPDAGITFTALDITERKQAEEALRESEARYRRIVETASESIAITDANFILTFANARLAQMTGYPLEEGLGKSVLEFMDEENAALVVREMEARQRGEGRDQYELKLTRKDGDDLWVLNSATPLFEEDGEFAGILAMLTDITERKQVEEAQRLALLGELAGSIAHEFNNLLAIMSGRAQLARALGTPQAQEELIEAVLHATPRAAKISRNLMGFARPSEPELGPLVVEEAIETALLLAERDFTNTGVEVMREYETGGALANADPSQMEQVFLNLVLNSCRAMQDGGNLTIATRHVPEQGGPGRIEVAVQDTGIGILREHMPRLFDPFFTTGGDERDGRTTGSGLGLPVSRSIVIAHGGDIRVQSEPGVGTTFTVSVPAWGDDVPPPRARREDDMRLPQAQTAARVLVADDEEDFCRVMGAGLREAGHEVTTAYTTTAALDVLRANSFDVIVCDLMMPGGGGRAILDAVQQLEHKPVVILVSGVLDQDRARQLATEGAAFCLAKPLQLPALLATVDEAIRRAKGDQA